MFNLKHILVAVSASIRFKFSQQSVYFDSRDMVLINIGVTEFNKHWDKPVLYKSFLFWIPRDHLIILYLICSLYLLLILRLFVKTLLALAPYYFHFDK